MLTVAGVVAVLSAALWGFTDKGSSTAATKSTAKPHSTSPHAHNAVSAKPSSSAQPAKPKLYGPIKVVHVSDGDTIDIMKGGTFTFVRLIGIDTPETKDPRKPTECFGKEASAQTTKLVNGKNVWLEYDPLDPSPDKFGRDLAYVYLDANGKTMLNEILVRDGFAHEYTYRGKYTYQTRMQDAEDHARDKKLGLWSPKTCNGDTAP